MKINEPRPVGGIGAAASRRDRNRRTKGTPGDPGAIADSASVMGIPEAELTPKVRAAILALMEEGGQLRRELEGARTKLVDLERVADQDSLVPVFNRRAFVRELSRVMSYSERYGTPSSVIYFDINAFKEINDTHGHAAGDAALEHVAGMLVDVVRESDSVGRLGGDEFGVILAHTDYESATEKAQMLAERIHNTPLIWNSSEIGLDVAYGVYAFSEGEDARHALEIADKAMYAQKNAMKEGA